MEHRTGVSAAEQARGPKARQAGLKEQDPECGPAAPPACPAPQPRQQHSCSPSSGACLRKQTLRGTPPEPHAGPRALTECGRWLPMPPGSSGPGNTSGTAGDRRQRSGQRAARPVRPPPGLSGLSRQHADTSAPSSLWAHLASEPSPTVPTTAPGKCRPGPSTRGHEFHPAACRWPCPCSRSSGQRPLARGCPAPSPSKLPRLQRLCRSQPHLHPHAASPCGRAQAPPPCPAALSPRKLPLLSPRSGLQAWPLRTLSQASGHRPRGPLPRHHPPALASRHLQEGGMADSWGPVCTAGLLAWGPRVPCSAFPSPP